MQSRHGIPKSIHLIWFGSMLPCTTRYPYRIHMIRWKKNNPNYRLNLWTDASSMTLGDMQELKAFCSLFEINLYDLREDTFQHFPNLDLMQCELTAKNWARASDIARISILYMLGGFYFDTDLEPIKKLGEIQTPTQGMLQYVEEDDEEKTCQIYFMASIKEHPIYHGCIVYLRDIYRILLNDPEYLLWFTSTDKEISTYATLYTTGNAFCKMFGETFDQAKLSAIQFPVSNYVNIKFSRSWQGQDDVEDNQAVRALLNHMDKMEQYENGQFKQLVQETRKACAAMYSTDKAFSCYKQKGVGLFAENTSFLRNVQAVNKMDKNESLAVIFLPKSSLC